MDEHKEELASDSAGLGHSYGMLMDKKWEVDGELSPETAEPAEEAEEVPPPPERIIEAMLFVGGPPLTAAKACEVVRGLSEPQFVQAIDALNQNYRREGRPYAIVLQGQGYALHLRPRFRFIVEKLYGSIREARLSPQAIDALALVAYRQPVSKQDVDSIRGMESGAILRQLVRRGLIAVVQRGEAGHREVSYGTTQRFLELFGLKGLDDLPQTQDLQKL